MLVLILREKLFHSLVGPVCLILVNNTITPKRFQNNLVLYMVRKERECISLQTFRL